MRWTVFLLTMLLALSGCSDDGDAPDGDDAGADGGSGDGAGPDGSTGGSDGGGSSDNSSATPEPVVVEVSTSGAYPVSIAFDPSTVSVPQGATVTVRFTNADQNTFVGHDWAVEGFEDTTQTPQAANGETVEVTFTADMEPGDYTFYCTIGDHRSQGMEGTFTVTA